MLTELMSALCERRLLKRRLKHIRSETLPYKNVMTMHDTFGHAFDHSRPMILGLASEFLPSDMTSSLASHQVITVRFLLDRVTSTPVSILRLIVADPVLAAPDCASLHRSAFEAAVNLLYLVHRDRPERLRSFYTMAFESERRMYNAIQRWREHDDQDIVAYANYQLSIQGPPTDAARDELFAQLGIDNRDDVERYPNIQQRCTDLGPIWEFFYDAKFRGLSAWQHGDTSRAAVSSSLMMHLPQYSDRTVFESLIILIWTWELIYHLICAMADVANVPLPESLNNTNAICHATASHCMREALEKYHLPVAQSEPPSAA